MLSSSSVIGCAVFVSSTLFVVSNPIPQPPYSQSGIGQPGLIGGQPGLMGGQSGMIGTPYGQSYGLGGPSSPYGASSRTTGHPGYPGAEDPYDSMYGGAQGSHYIPGTAGRTASNAGVLGAEGGHGGFHSSAHLTIPSAGWFMVSGFAGLLSLVL